MPALRVLHTTGGSDGRRQARLRLSALARRYGDATGERIVLVFDGTSGATHEAVREDGFQEIYSGGGKTADDVIEQLAAKYAPAGDVTVLTEDGAERAAVAACGAAWMSAASFEQRLARLDRPPPRRKSAPFNTLRWPGGPC